MRPTSEARRLGRYILGPPIAHGGMGTVHLGRLVDADLARIFVIKVVSPAYATSPAHAKMLLTEGKLSARIHSPFVVATTDIIRDGDELGLVMELVFGVPLSTILERLPAGSRVPLPIASALLGDVLRGLHAAHVAVDDAGQPLDIVHRDVSPHNVMVGADGFARLIDFGIAKALGTDLVTGTGEIKGKIGYMAPEQLKGAPVTKRTDIYAAGVLLWEIVAGRKLRGGTGGDANNVAAALLEILHNEAPRLDELDLAPAVPPDVAEIAQHAMEKEPPDRYSSAEAMAFELESACPPASRAEVSAFVSEIAVEELDRLKEHMRAAKALSVIAAKAPTEPPREAEPREVAKTGPGTKTLFFLASFVVTVVAGVAYLLLHEAPRQPSVSSPMITPSVSSVTAAIDPPSPMGTDETDASAVAPARSVVSTGRRAGAPSKAAPSSPSAAASTARATADCTPPYWLDPDGKKHYKPECFAP